MPRLMTLVVFAAMAACIPSGYSARTGSSSRSCTFSPHTVTRIGSLTT